MGQPYFLASLTLSEICPGLLLGDGRQFSTHVTWDSETFLVLILPTFLWQVRI